MDNLTRAQDIAEWLQFKADARRFGSSETQAELLADILTGRPVSVARLEAASEEPRF